MPGRVDWGARDGNEIEAVLANLMYNKSGRAIRVRPGQGDFGVDIIVPVSEEPAPWDVYQVKKYAANLTSSQRIKIVESFSRLLIGFVRENLPVNDWYLVTPLDPTLINDLQGWFADLPESAIAHAKGLRKSPLTEEEEAKARAWLEEPGRKIEWKGLPFCDSLAAEYWYVVDYYLHSGRDRIRDAVDSVAGLLSGDMNARAASTAEPGDGSTALLEPSEIVEHLTVLDTVLDTDPHYTYGHSISPTEPQFEYEPNLVAAAMKALPNGKWLTFRIYQRSAQSLEERPIPMHLQFHFEEGSAEHEAFENWQKYGKPFEAPATASIDLPGGLGTEGKEGIVSVPAPHARDNYVLRMRVVAPDDIVLAELEFNMNSTAGADGKGAWTAGIDPSGVLESEGFYDIAPDATQRVNFTLQALAGQVAAEVQPAVRFARHLEAPNRIQLARRIGMFQDMIGLDGAEGMVPPSIDKFVTSLATIQTRTNHLIRIPDLSQMTNREVRDVHRAAALISGDTQVGIWNKQTIQGVEPGKLAPGEHIQLQVEVPLRIELNETLIELGVVEQTILSTVVTSIDGTQVRVEPKLNNTVHERLVPSPGAPLEPGGTLPVRSRKYPDHHPEASDPIGKDTPCNAESAYGEGGEEE
jgi:hypothetical protein